MKTAALIALCAAALFVGWHFYDANTPDADKIAADRASIERCRQDALKLSGASMNMHVARCSRMRDEFIAKWRRDP